MPGTDGEVLRRESWKVGHQPEFAESRLSITDKTGKALPQRTPRRTEKIGSLRRSFVSLRALCGKGGAYSSRGIEVLLISFQWTNSPVDNKSIAGILFETADLLEVDGGDSFRIRSYRNAAEAIEAFPQQISDLIANEKDVLAIPGS